MRSRRSIPDASRKQASELHCRLGYGKERLHMMDRKSSFDVLRAYLEARASFTEEELAYLRTMFIPVTLGPGEFLQRGGEVAKYTGFVAIGCLRKYVIDSTGKEHIVSFAPENWWVADGLSLASGTPSQYFIEAVEESDVLLIDAPSHEQIVQRVPGIAAAYRKGLQRAAAARDERIVRTISGSARERYQEFLRTYPSIAARVPQWMVASYLGISPETVSRIRRDLSRR